MLINTTYTLNGQNRVKTKIRTGGGTSPWYELMPQKHTPPGSIYPKPQPTIKYTPQLRNAINQAKNQHLEYEYHPGGKEAVVTDYLRGLRSEYATNLSGQRTGVRLIDTVTGQTLRNQQASLDALGREYWIRDDMTDIHRGFTATSDIRFMLTHITIGGKTADSRGFWWDYDINRNVKVCGLIQDSKFTQNIVSEYLYENGLRTADLSTASDGVRMRKTRLTYKHDKDLRLEKTTFTYEGDPIPIAETSRVHDRNDRVTGYYDTGTFPLPRPAPPGTRANFIPVSHAIIRNHNGYVTQDIRTRHHINRNPGVTSTTTLVYAKNASLPESCTRNFTDDSGRTGKEVTGYATWAKDTVAIFRVNTERTLPEHEPSRGESVLYTGPNGELSALMGAMSSDGATTENRFFTTGPDGNIIEKIIVNLNGWTGSLRGKRIFSTLNGEPLGEMDYIIDTDLARTAAKGSLLPRLSSSIAKLSGPCTIYGPRLPVDMAEQKLTYWMASRHFSQNGLPTLFADIGTPGELGGAAEQGAQMHTVNIGESYESIARKMYGNTESAWLIALVNGNHRLFPGMQIKIPYQIPGSRYHADTSLPYHQFISIMQGNMSPWLPANERLPGPEEKHRFLKRLVGILAVAIAVMLAIPSGGILPGLGLGLKVAAFLQVSSTVATNLVIAAVAGFINAGIQGVMAGFGIKDFSVAEMITAAFAAGSAGWIQEAAVAVTSAPSAEATLLLSAKAASVNIAEQMMLLSIGQQQKFDFAQATTAALGAVADARLAKYTGDMHRYPRALAHTTTGALVTGAVRKSMDLEQLAAQLVASTVIHAAVPAVMQGVQWVNNNVFGSAASTSPAPVQQPVKTGAKKQANASKHNIHDSERKHHSPAMSQEAFMEKMGIGELMEDYHRAKSGFAYAQSREHQKSYIPSINDPHGVRQLITNASEPESIFWDYLDEFNHAVERGRDRVAYMVTHPFGVIAGLAVASFDGYNALTDSLFGISTQGSRLRNAQRTMDFYDTIDRFAEGSGPTRFGMITAGVTETILSGNLGGVFTTGKMPIVKTQSPTIVKSPSPAIVKSRELFGFFKPKEVIVNNALKEEIAALHRIGINAKTYNKTTHQTINLKGAQVSKNGFFASKNILETGSATTLANKALDQLKLTQKEFSARSPNAADALARKYEALKGAQQRAIRTEILDNGQIKFYLRETLANKPGPTRGSAYVTEYNPKTGDVYSFMESYDHLGNVNRIHPKMYNGQTLQSPHYPPTLKDKLEAELYSSYRR